MTKKTGFPQALHDFEGYNNSDTMVFNREPSLTRQEFLDECDINKVMERYNSHVIGGPGNMSPAQPMYFDFADLPQDLMGYMQFMADAEKAFMTLPAVVRKEFDNDPVAFVEYASDPSSLEQMRSWGLAAPAKAPDASSAAPSGQPTAPAAASPAPAEGASTHGPT